MGQGVSLQRRKRQGAALLSACRSGSFQLADEASRGPGGPLLVKRPWRAKCLQAHYERPCGLRASRAADHALKPRRRQLLPAGRVGPCPAAAAAVGNMLACANAQNTSATL